MALHLDELWDSNRPSPGLRTRSWLLHFQSNLSNSYSWNLGKTRENASSFCILPITAHHPRLPWAIITSGYNTLRTCTKSNRTSTPSGDWFTPQPRVSFQYSVAFMSLVEFQICRPRIQSPDNYLNACHLGPCSNKVLSFGNDATGEVSTAPACPPKASPWLWPQRDGASAWEGFTPMGAACRACRIACRRSAVYCTHFMDQGGSQEGGGRSGTMKEWTINEDR